MTQLKLKILGALLFTTTTVFSASLVQEPASKPVAQEQRKVVLTASNHVALTTAVTDESVSEVISKMTKLLENRENDSPIYLVLDTPGGSVFAGFKLYEFLKPYKNIQTITLYSYSMGAVLAELISGKRLMIETGTIMFHSMSISLPPRMKINEIWPITHYLLARENFAVRKISERTGIPKEQLDAEFSNELYMDAETALERNFVDEIVTVQCDSKLIKQVTTKSVQILPFLPATEVKSSACPLL